MHGAASIDNSVNALPRWVRFPGICHDCVYGALEFATVETPL